MNLRKLIKGLDIKDLYGQVDKDILSIADNTKDVKKDSLFVAIKGTKIDSHVLINEAVSKGAIAVVGENNFEKKWGNITYIKVGNSREALALVASNWYGNPAKNLKVIGVTGTDGKTTTANLIYWILKHGGKNTGLISTIDAKVKSKTIDTGFHVTNPDALSLQKILFEMKKSKCKYAVLEVTSHGIDQKRVYGINFETVCLTNITNEHLDYHKTFENYRDVKAKLFENVKYAVLNKDDPSCKYIRRKSNANKFYFYSLTQESDYLAYDIKTLGRKTSFKIKAKNKTLSVSVDLMGQYNVLNVLCAVAVARIYQIRWERISSALKSFQPPEGRLEKIKNDKGIEIYVDFAHTPNALENLLSLLKSVVLGRLICVFGCAGERDVQKRITMPQISIKYADVSIFTAEDPRNEDVNDILSAMAEAAKKAGGVEINKNSYSSSLISDRSKFFLRMPERGEAIYFAINEVAQKRDLVVICGKGHEKSMSYYGIEYPWSDKEAVRMSLDGKLMLIPWKNL